MPTQITGLTITNGEIKIDYSNTRHYAEGVNWWPTDYGSKVQWMYNCTENQGEACKNPPVDDIINNTKVNYISFIQNLSIVAPEDLVIGIPMSSTIKTMADPCIASSTKCSCVTASCEIYPNGKYMQGSAQTSQSDDSDTKLQPCGQRQLTLPYTKEDLRLLHEAGITLALTLGSWCSRFPRISEILLWTDGKDLTALEQTDYTNFLPGATKFVNIFKTIRKDSGNVLDGIDFDWEGYCYTDCLGTGCGCTWGTNCTGDGNEPNTVMGVDGTTMKTSTNKNCKTPIYNNMGVHSGDDLDTTCWTLVDQVTISIMNAIAFTMNNEGFTVTGVPISSQFFTNSIDPTDNDQNQYVRYKFKPDFYDGIMLQWYSGFDAGICDKTKSEDNYPRPIANENIKSSKFKDLCQAKNKPRANYSNYNGRSIYHCPRAIDCPDWKYEGSEDYQEQTNLIKKLELFHKGITSKLVVGFEFYTGVAQWGPEPLPEDWDKLNKKLSKDIGADLAGYGGWTIYGTMDATDNCGSHDGDPWTSHKHFRQNLDKCWGSWGRYNKETPRLGNTAICTNIPSTDITPHPTQVTGLKQWGCDWISNAPAAVKPDCTTIQTGKLCNCTSNCIWGTYNTCDTATCWVPQAPAGGFKPCPLPI
jgi:hypothetical protein